jgi:UDP-N-acetylglucosamine 1-carboxyvinyltransferase
MGEILTAFGCTVSWESDHSLCIDVPAGPDIVPVAPAHLVAAMRASLVALGPLLARCGAAQLSLPGGDDFGGRPINFHTDGLSAMGAEFENTPGVISARRRGDRLRAARITLEYPSHTATDNLLMAAVLADGRSVIDNAAKEPEVEDLGRQLIAMGARIEGLGTSRLTIDGVAELHPADHSVITDRVVTATYLAAGLISGGEVCVRDARREHMDRLLAKFETMGAEVRTDEGVTVRAPRRLRATDVATLPYPGVATDYKPLITTLLTTAEGVSVVTENLFYGRFRYVDELVKLGAVISTEDHHAVIRGVDALQGAVVWGTDIRAAAALSLAGLVATGETEIHGLEHLERGYDQFVDHLTNLGAMVSVGA